MTNKTSSKYRDPTTFWTLRALHIRVLLIILTFAFYARWFGAFEPVSISGIAFQWPIVGQLPYGLRVGLLLYLCIAGVVLCEIAYGIDPDYSAWRAAFQGLVGVFAIAHVFGPIVVYVVILLPRYFKLATGTA